jgi:hypothetical protein
MSVIWGVDLLWVSVGSVPEAHIPTGRSSVSGGTVAKQKKRSPPQLLLPKPCLKRNFGNAETSD